MSYNKNQLFRRISRKEFRDRVKIYCKVNNIYQKDISESLGLTESEFTRLMTGVQCSAPSRDINNFSDFKIQVSYYLGNEFGGFINN